MNYVKKCKPLHFWNFEVHFSGYWI